MTKPRSRWTWLLTLMLTLATGALLAPTAGPTAAAADRTPRTTGQGDRLADAFRPTKCLKAGKNPRSGMLSNGCRYTARGIPTKGVYVGAAHGSNSDPTRLERSIGSRLGVRRTYFTADQVRSAVRTARQDLRKNRLPWVSFKLPHSWSAMASGAGDRWARNLSKRLKKLRGPVWVAFHHEPEGDGNLQDWRRMQERLIPIVRKTAPNVAFTIVVTGWHQFYGDDEYSLRQIWPRRGHVDVAGFDVYQQYGVVKDGRSTTSWTDFSEYFRQIARWARSKDVAWGLAETGVTGTAADARPDIIPNTVKLMKRHGGVAYSYFDTTLNSVADWTLRAGPKRDGFARAADRAPRMRG